MRTARTVALTLTLLVAGTLQGCAGVGRQDFACPGHPGRPLCLSASEVYRLTDDAPALQARPAARWRDAAPRIEDELFLEGL
jgi:hypothetical protein